LTGILTDQEQENLLVLESCHSTWLFDPVEHKFCRLMKDNKSVATEWVAYDKLVVHEDSDAFVVFLDESGTKLLRSWRHTDHCEQCGGNATAELSLADLQKVMQI